MTINHMLTALAPLLLSGCGSFVPTEDLSDLSLAETQAIEQVTIYDDNLLAQKPYEIIDIVEGNSCQNKIWDPPATRAGAIDQIQFYANAMGRMVYLT